MLNDVNAGISSGARTAMAVKSSRKKRIAFVVSHPIQYYAPLHQRLARRTDIEIKVFFTWHPGETPTYDRGFGMPVAWDIPLTEGYNFEAVPNLASDPGMHHFFGVRNPTLVDCVKSWHPDVIHITGWAVQSHALAMRAFSRSGIPTLFRGDSHLLDFPLRGPKWWLKRAVLRQVYSWPTLFLYTGAANRDYYQALSVPPERLVLCPHSVDVRRFAEPADEYERQAQEWRQELGIPASTKTVLFAAKFESRKRPLELMDAFLDVNDPNSILIMLGNGELEQQVKSRASAQPDRFRLLPFQNQSRMPVVYRIGDVYALPSSNSETWGLAVNEAMASGRPVMVSDRVGCAPDVVTPACGSVYPDGDPQALRAALRDILSDSQKLLKMRQAASENAWKFDIQATEKTLMDAVEKVCLQ